MPSNYEYTGSGGISFGGPQDHNPDPEIVDDDLGIMGSSDRISALGVGDFTYTGSGGISINGVEDNIVDYAYCTDHQTPVTISGSADAVTSGNTITVNFTFTASGGLSVNGVEDNIVDYAYCVDGQPPIIIGGSAVASTTGGTITVNFSYVGSGGISINGVEDNIVDYTYCADHQTPVTIGGSAIADASGVTVNYIYNGSGRIVVGGGIEQTTADYICTMSGGIEIGGAAALDVEINIDVGIGWVTYAIITVDVAIGWNTGSTPLFFYRVEGECQPIQCPPIADSDPANKNCNYTFIQNIVASNVCDVCTQLADSRFLRTIKSIKQFSNPARESDILAFEAEGKIDPLCNNLTPVDFCQCLPCAQFCDYESTVAGTNTVTTTQTTTVVQGHNVTYESQITRNYFGMVVEQYYYPIYTPEYITLIKTSTTEKPEFRVQTTGRVRVSGHAIVSWKPYEIPLTADTGQILTSCGCTIPTEIYFTHDLGKAAKLSDFLRQNGLKIDRTAKLFYSSVKKAWFNNLQYKGVGLDGVSQERWSIFMSFECTNIVDGWFDVGNPYYWKLTILVRQENLTSNMTYNTRIQVNMTDDGPCQRGELAVSAYVNVKTQRVQPIDPPNTSLGVMLTDKIGIFRGSSWVNNPRFFVGLTVYDVSQGINDIRFGPLYPQIEVSRLN